MSVDLSRIATADMDRNAAPPGHVEVPMQTSYLAIVGSVLCGPLLLPGACWVLEPRTEAVVLNCGVLTAHKTEVRALARSRRRADGCGGLAD